MSLQFICIEIRRNLHCANIFLQFAENLTDTEFVKIHIREDTILLREYSTETHINLTNYFTIKAHTLSNLIVKDANASFRISIENILNNEDCTGNKREDMNTETPWQMQLQIVENVDFVALHCSNCKFKLTSKCKFQKIREFPSGSIDMSEFFCHHEPNSNFDEVLVPKTTDLYYGFLFVILNVDLVKDSTKHKESHIYCKRCLQYMGETMLSGKAGKLWSDTLLLNYEGTFKNIFVSSSDKEKNSHTCQLLHKIIRESAISNEPLLHQMHFTKVILQSSLPNRKCKYLLLHILEKQLEVLRNQNELVHGCCHKVLQVQLDTNKCFKVLYCVVDEKSKKEESVSVAAIDEALDTQTLLANWQKDISIYCLKISPTLFTELVKELGKNSLLLPDLYRYAQDNFQLSYIFCNN